eukprot:m51a1_g9404 hypothetical protein (112) ;mRNA; r:303926-304261
MPVEAQSIDFITAAASRDLSDTSSPMTIQLSGGGSVAAGANSSGSGPIMAMPLGIGTAPVYDMSLSLAPVSRTAGLPSMELPPIPSYGSVQLNSGAYPGPPASKSPYQMTQ